jgi:hypothetical protein
MAKKKGSSANEEWFDAQSHFKQLQERTGIAKRPDGLLSDVEVRDAASNVPDIGPRRQLIQGHKARVDGMIAANWESATDQRWIIAEEGVRHWRNYTFGAEMCATVTILGWYHWFRLIGAVAAAPVSCIQTVCHLCSPSMAGAIAHAMAEMTEGESYLAESKYGKLQLSSREIATGEPDPQP